MPPARLALILISVILAAGLTVAVAARAAPALPGGLGALLLVTLAAALLVRLRR